MRNVYLNKIRTEKDKNSIKYYFDFSALYIITYKGIPFAATSPFTGFFTQADCNLLEVDIKLKDAKNNERRLFTNIDKDFRDIKSRSEAFKRFLYLLLRDTGLQHIYNNMYTAVKMSFTEKEIRDMENTKFNDFEAHRKFNILTETRLLKIHGQDAYIRPDNMDCCYLRYLLFLDKPADLSITDDEYKLSIDQRSFDGEHLRWVGANDILSDALYVLPYEINDNYVSIPYIDMDDGANTYNRLLIPIKSSSIPYLPTDYLQNNMGALADAITVRKRDGIFTVKMVIPLEGGGQTVIRREYTTTQKNVENKQNGTVISTSEIEPFAFGIYPFIKSEHYQNIYKIMFYNHFDNSEYRTTFYLDDYAGGTIHECALYDSKANTGEVHVNQTNIRGKGGIDMNCIYYHINLQRAVGLGFVEVGKVDADKKGLKDSALIVPKLKSVDDNNTDVIVSVDLGTSNTYIAYDIKGDTETRDISTIHTTNQGTTWHEFTLLNKAVESKKYPQNGNDFLYDDVKPDAGMWLNTQLCEFIPSHISSNQGNSYKFPIPTVINNLRQNASRKKLNNQKQEEDHQDNKNEVQEAISLFNTAIPFAYYKNGIRTTTEEGLNYYDSIVSGKEFKWFYTKQGNDPTNAAAFKSFVEEILFLVRSHLLCCGFGLNNCQLIWSYPLSFDGYLKDDYQTTWESGFSKYINSDPAKIHYTNESRTPIYSCNKDVTTFEDLTLLIDIGGGSTDVIGYRHQQPLFVTSFGFAGNSLYLEGSRNSSNINKDYNYLYQEIKGCIERKEINTNLMETMLKNESFSSIMNYGFSEAENDMNKLFRRDKVKFMLLFYSSSIIFHIAQLCHIQSKDSFPVRIFFTGNGSKLLDILKSSGLPTKKEIIDSSFEHIYGTTPNKDEDLVIPLITEDVKQATAKGALKGLRDETLETGEDSADKQIIMLGDKNNCYNKAINDDAKVDESLDYCKEVKSNIDDFIDFFYTKICTKNEWIKIYPKDKMKNSLTNIKDTQLSLGEDRIITDSLFFKGIALLMEKVSSSFCTKKQ